MTTPIFSFQSQIDCYNLPYTFPSPVIALNPSLYFRRQKPLQNPPFRPPPPLNRQLHRRMSPILTMIMLIRRVSQTCPLQALLLIQQRQHAKNHRHARLQLHPHQPMTDRIGNVLEMHRSTLDQHADGNHGVEWCEGAVVAGPGEIHCGGCRGGEEVGCARCAGTCSLDMGCLNQTFFSIHIVSYIVSL